MTKDAVTAQSIIYLEMALTLLRIWLTGFLGAVGLMKGAGKLWHPLVSSQLADKKALMPSDNAYANVIFF
jgi:hypothetical protein